MFLLSRIIVYTYNLPLIKEHSKEGYHIQCDWKILFYGIMKYIFMNLHPFTALLLRAFTICLFSLSLYILIEPSYLILSEISYLILSSNSLFLTLYLLFEFCSVSLYLG